MNLWAVGMVKDEADVIAGTLEHLADEGVTGIVVADNGSTDGTTETLHSLDLPCELVIVNDPELGYYQSKKMTQLAHRAGDMGATWIVPFDADEVWTAPDRLSVTLSEADRMSFDVVRASLFHHFPTALDPEGHPFETIQWRQAEPAPLPKVAFRWHPSAVIHQGNHGVDLSNRPRIVDTWAPHDVDRRLLEIRHFPHRTVEQFIRKARNGAAAYNATDLPENQGAHWRQYGQLLATQGEDALADVFREWYWFLAPVEAGMIHDPAPWMRWR